MRLTQLKAGLAAAALLGAGLGTLTVAAPAQAQGPTCTATNVGQGGRAWCRADEPGKVAVFFSCRRLANGAIYPVVGPYKRNPQVSAASCYSGDIRIDNAWFDKQS